MNLVQNTNLYNVAIYCRLSSEDRNSIESSSISTQKDLLNDYVKRNNWNVYKIYSDDGYSGTTFERPAFKEMIEDIDTKKVNLVITKDLSRLGRNYIQTGYYTEQYFPENNIRYIAINDNYDSIETNNDFMPFKNIMNEIIAKDTSRKIRFAYNSKCDNGTVNPSQIPYGYLREGKKIVVDYEVKDTITYIFDTYIKTGKTTMIAQDLNERKVLTPGQYRNMKLNYKCNGDSDSKWTRRTIEHILSSKAYYGVFEGKKTFSISFKDKRRHKNTKEKRVYIEGIFEPIMSKDYWEKVDALRKLQKSNPYSTELNKYNGIVVCMDCGSNLNLKHVKNYDSSYYNYYCKKNHKCSNHNCITIDTLDKTVREDLLEVKEILINNTEEIISRIKAQIANTTHEEIVLDNSNIVKKLKDRNYILDGLIEKVMEKYVEGLIPLSTCDSLLVKYKTEKFDIETKLKDLEIKVVKKEEINYEDNIRTVIEQLKLINKDTEITRDLIISMFDKIQVKSVKVTHKVHNKLVHIEYKGLPPNVRSDIFESFKSSNLC